MERRRRRRPRVEFLRLALAIVGIWTKAPDGESPLPSLLPEARRRLGQFMVRITVSFQDLGARAPIRIRRDEI